MTLAYLRAGLRPMAEPVLFLHGIGGGAACFQWQLDGLSDRFDCIAWDAPGFGRSSRLDDVTFPALAQAVCRLLDQLEIPAVHLVGHSLGGMIAQELAATRPERLKSLVLACTSPSFGRPDGEFQMQFVADRLGPLARGQSMAEIAGEVIPTLMPRASAPDVALAVACMAAIPEDVYAATVRCLVTFNRLKSLPEIRVPTLALAAEKDAAAPPMVLEKMAAKIPGAQYRCIPEAGHLANMEMPKLFNQEIRRFLDGVAS